MRHSADLIPCLVIGVALWLSYTVFKIAVADLIYPQQQVLQPSHWVYQMSHAKQKRRLEYALRWTPTNGWYLQTLGRLMAAAAPPSQRNNPSDSGQHTASRRQRAAHLYHQALQQTPTEPYLQLASRTTLGNLASDPEHAYAPQVAAKRTTPYAHIATLAPTDAHLHYRIGVLLLAEAAQGLDRMSASQRQSTQAWPFFRRAMQLDPAYYARTLQTYQTSFSAAAAVARFARAIPQTPQGHAMAAQQLEKVAWLHARQHYLAALALDASSPSLIRDYAQALQRHGAFEAAIKMWERLRHMAPDDATAHLGLADAHGALGNRAAERQALQQLVKRFPQQADYLDRLAHTYWRHGLISEATAAWQTLIARRPESVRGYLGLADMHESQQNYPAAITMMRHVVHLTLGTLTHHRRLAQLYMKTSENAKALREYKRLAALRPDNPWALYHLGEYFRHAGEYHRAITYYRRAQSLDTRQALYWRQMGLAYAARREHDRAERAYRQALSLDGTDADTHYYLGISYEAAGTPELARSSYIKAVQFAPENALFQQALHRLCCSSAWRGDASP